MNNLDAVKLVSDNYSEYATFVNGFRSIPNSLDGLKLVQRRILATLFQLPSGKVPSPAVVGDCNKKFHPHGEVSIYGAIVNMVNSPTQLISGSGNFGRKTFSANLGASAQRYTKVSTTPFCDRFYKTLIEFTGYYENENSYQEPTVVPTPYPYALLNGASGIGVGCATNIPAFDFDDLTGAVRDIIKSLPPRTLRPRSTGGGKIEIDAANLKSLNEEGYGTGTAVAKYHWVWDKDSQQQLIKISDVPDYVNLSKLNFILKDEIDEGLVFIREDTQKGSTSIELSIGRNKRIKRISDQELEAKVARVCRRRLTWNCVFARDGIAQQMSPLCVLRDSVEYAIKCYLKFLISERDKILSDIRFEEVKNLLAKEIMNGKSPEDIIKILGITKEEYNQFSSRSISRLRSAPKDVKLLKQSLTKLDQDIKNPRTAYGYRMGII
jgi:DNA gyrase/topoisomerase IV subunit A